MGFLTTTRQLAVFRRGAIDLIDVEGLTQRIERSRATGTPLRVKFGMDPSSPDLHVGHAVQLKKLAAIQELGHTVVLIVGDATALVGDPSGRNKLRPQLSRAEVERNLATYVDQARLVLDFERTEVHRNSRWFDAMSFEDILKLTSRMTVARMLERDTFQKRVQDSEPIGIHEFLYPLMQGWDSVEIKADLELGGSDQLFNLLVGRHLQEQEGAEGQICLTLPLINGLDGRKMSKSYGNFIGLTEAANEMFGKTMSIADDVMELWFTLLTDLSDEERAAVLAGHPREAKARLGWEIARSYHGSAAADEARAAFDRQFQAREVPEGVPEHPWPDPAATELPLANLLTLLGLCSSNSDARRLVQQKAVKLAGEPATDPMQPIPRTGEDLLIQVGKRRFARLTRGAI